MTLRRALLVLFSATLLALIAYFADTQPDSAPAPRPIAEWPDVYYVEADEWPDLVLSGQPPGTGWVLLPLESAGPDYRTTKDPAKLGFLRPQVCGDCHRENYDEFVQTAHFRTSAQPAPGTILGSFEEGSNLLWTNRPGFFFRMTAGPDGFFQELHATQDRRSYTLRQRIDIVVGSGNHGQSYLSWFGDRLCQMHVSYFTEVQGWTNGPGFYRDGTADFARPITGRCLECHATWFAQVPGSVNRYDRRTYLLGVTCVRCHGPAHEHVAHHRAAPGDSEGRHIVHPGKLRRDRLNEVCAQCHSGAGDPLRPAFGYVPGEPLAEYIKIDLSGHDPRDDDPHAANQLARLQRSRCYQQDETMTCITCHDPHRHERGDLRLFSSRCGNCHQSGDCGWHPSLGGAIEGRCVSCHMTSQRDELVSAESVRGMIMPLLRDHYIGVWPEVAAAVRIQLERRTQGAGNAARSGAN